MSKETKRRSGEAEKRAEHNGVATAAIRVPVGEFACSTEATTHVDLHLNAQETRTLWRIFEGVKGESIRTTGRKIETKQDVVRYLLAEVQRAAK